MAKSAKKVEHEEMGSYGHTHYELGKLEDHASKGKHHRGF